MASKNGTLLFEDSIVVTKGTFVTQDALKEHQNITRSMTKYAAKLKVEKTRKDELENLFVQAHLEGKRSAKGDGKLQLIVTEGPSTSIPWKEYALELAVELGKDKAAYEAEVKAKHTKQVSKVKVI